LILPWPLFPHELSKLLGIKAGHPFGFLEIAESFLAFASLQMAQSGLPSYHLAGFGKPEPSGY
jgi:hypothetical protein